MNQSGGGVIVRVTGVFIVIGLGLGLGALLFLWSIDFFKPTEPKDLGEALGSTLLAGLTIAAVLVFALLVGVVVAAIGGLHAAHTVNGRGNAVVAAFAAGLFGHVLMITVLGALLIGGISILRGSSRETTAEPSPSPTPEETRSAEELASCRELFGQDSVICQPPGAAEPTGPEESVGDSEPVDVGQLIKLAYGMLPAAVVGACSAALFYGRRRPS